MHKVTSVSEETFRQVDWRDLALKITKNLHCVHMRRKVTFWCSEISLVDRRDLGEVFVPYEHNFPTSGENFLS